MKKFIMIFSTIFVVPSLNGFPFEVELKLLIARYLKAPNEAAFLPRTPQTYINEHKKELLEYFAADFNLVEPLPFVYCVYPAILDIVQSHQNKDLFEQAIANPCFSPDRVIHAATRSNIFHTCCAAGTNKFLKRLLNHCKDRHINYRSLMNARNNNGLTPLGLATKYSRTKCVSLLLSHGASVDAQPGSLMHFAASANTRGETKRNAVIQRLCEYDETLTTAVNSLKKGAEVAAATSHFITTEKLIVRKKLELYQQLYEESAMYFQLLPQEIYEITLQFAIDSKSLANPQNAQS